MEMETLQLKEKPVFKTSKFCGYPYKGVPIRFWIAIMVFFSTYINYTTRVNMSLTITAMVVPKGGSSANSTNQTDTNQTVISKGTECTTDVKQKVAQDLGPQYEWSQDDQGWIIAAYFIGYVISCIPGGYFTECVGPFWTLFVTTLAAGILNSACVWATYYHWIALAVLRFLIGVTAGPVYPALQTLISKWAPPAEKGKFVAALMGNTLGTCLTWILGGVFMDMTKDWAWGFHFITIQIAVYLIVLCIVVRDSPEQHKWVSKEELEYIKEAQGAAVSTQKTKAAPPYLKIFMSVPFWALCICHIGNLWGLYLQLTGVPKFMKEVIGFDIKNSGWTSAVPQLVRMFLGIGFGSLGDFIKKRNLLSPQFSRRFFILFSHIIPGLLIGSMGLVGCSATAAIVLLTLSQSLNGAAVLTNLQNPQDLAPNYAGTIFGIISTIGGCTGFITPKITAALIANHNGIKEWSINFIIGGSVYIGCGIIFIIFCSTKIQPWNERRTPQEQT